MNKIIIGDIMDTYIAEVTNNIVKIVTGDGKTLKIDLCDMNFRPSVGQIVRVFQEDKLYIVNDEYTVDHLEEKLEANTETVTEEKNNEYNEYVYVAQPLPLYDAFGRKRVNKVAYCLLAFFAGSIGIHKFYSGKVAKGVIYLLFCWTFIPSIVSFIEAIIGITKEADVYGNIYI